MTPGKCFGSIEISLSEFFLPVWGEWDFVGKEARERKKDMWFILPGCPNLHFCTVMQEYPSLTLQVRLECDIGICEIFQASGISLLFTRHFFALDK